MKFLVALFFVSICYYWYNSYDKNKTFIVKYYYEGDRDECVYNGLNSWYKTNIKFERVFDKSKAILTIDHLPQNKCDIPNEVAEYQNNKIHINKDYYTNDKQITGVIAHEIGHYFGLHHNKDDSVMNIEIPYGILPTDLDIRRVLEKRHFFVKFH
jgi:hypothetical protein